MVNTGRWFMELEGSTRTVVEARTQSAVGRIKMEQGKAVQ